MVASLGYQIFFLGAQGALQLYFCARLSGKGLTGGALALYLAALVGVARCPSELGMVALWALVLYGANRLLLSNGRAVSAAAALLALYVSYLAMGVVNVLSVLTLTLVPSWLAQGAVLTWLFGLAALALGGSGYALIIRCFPLAARDEWKTVWLLLPSGLFLFAVEVYIFGQAFAVLVIPQKLGGPIQLLFLQLLGLGALYGTLYAQRRLQESLESQQAVQALEQAVQAQKKLVAQAQARDEQTRAFRHDLKNHLRVLEGLWQSGHFEQARDYLQEMTDLSHQLTREAYTGQAVVDALLNDKLSWAQASGVQTTIRLHLPQDGAVADWDWCVLLANALDNALAALKQLEGPRWLSITGEQQGDFYYLELANACSSEAQITEGTGMANMQTVAKKYGGLLTWEIKQGVFRLSVLLNISRQLENHSGQAS